MDFRERETVELKTSIVADIKKRLAFANCEGGKIYIGVKANGEVISVGDLDGVALQTSNMVSDVIKSDLSMFLHVVSFG